MQIHWFMIFKDSVLMRLSLDVKLAGHVKRRHANVEGNSESYIRHFSYGLHFKTLVIKYAVSHDTNIQRWKEQNQKLCQFCAKIVIYTESETEQNVSVIQHHYSVRGTPTYGAINLCQTKGWMTECSLV